MRIDLRGRDVRVPEHFLDAHDFGAIFEQVRGEAMAQYVRACFPFPADFTEQVVDVVTECADGEWLAVFAQEHVARFARCMPGLDFCGPEFPKPCDKRICDGDDAFLVAFTDDANKAFFCA